MEELLISSHSPFSALDLANTLWALGKMGIKPPQRVLALFEVHNIYICIHTYICGRLERWAETQRVLGLLEVYISIYVYIHTYIHTYYMHTYIH
jgi:hypothetical protein